jgi:hypothetical protein
MIDVVQLSMNSNNEVDLHTTEPVPVEHLFRVICNLRKQAVERMVDECDT